MDCLGNNLYDFGSNWLVKKAHAANNPKQKVCIIPLINKVYVALEGVKYVKCYLPAITESSIHFCASYNCSEEAESTCV